MILNLYKCTLSSSYRSDVEDMVVLFYSDKTYTLQKMFNESFGVKYCKFHEFDAVHIELVALKDIPKVLPKTISKKKLYETIKVIMSENPVLFARTKKEHAVNHLVTVIMKAIRGRASPKMIREIIYKIIERKSKDKNFVITADQAFHLHQFCHDCKTTNIDKYRSYKVTLCSMHEHMPIIIKKMLDDGRKYYCPVCNTLSFSHNGEGYYCKINNCRVKRFSSQ